MLERHQKGQGSTFALERVAFRIAVLIGEQLIGERLQPDRLPQPWRQGACGIGLWMRVWWQGPCRDTGERIQAQIGGDAVQPGTVRSRARECRAFLPCPQQCLLHEVFGVVERAQHPIAMHEQFTPIRSHQGIESRPIARLSGEHQCSLGWSLHRGISSSRLLILPDPVMFTG